MAKVRSCALDWPDPRDEEQCRAYSLYVEERVTSEPKVPNFTNMKSSFNFGHSFPNRI